MPLCLILEDFLLAGDDPIRLQRLISSLPGTFSSFPMDKDLLPAKKFSFVRECLPPLFRPLSA